MKNEKRPFTLSVVKTNNTVSKRTKRGRKTDNSSKLYCICRMPFFKSDSDNGNGLFMICCSECEKWYRKKCENVHSSRFKDEAETGDVKDASKEIVKHEKV